MIDMRKSLIEQALAEFIDPLAQQSLMASKAVKNIILKADSIEIDISLGYPHAGIKAQLEDDIAAHVSHKTGLQSVQVNCHYHCTRHQVQQGVSGIKHIKNIIAVGSGKGGVGKSTVSVNLALALQAEGATVGLLDADIYGPSQPLMLGSFAAPESLDKKTIQPIIRYGLASMSIGYLVDMNTPMIWRGPMVSGALQQLLNDTQWPDLDYLIIDLPPGTGDIQLTLAQKIPVSGAIIVTTPQDLALLDARRAVGMFNKVNIPVLGIIENMSLHTCGACGHTEAIFGQGGAAKMAEEFKLPVLGELPLDIRIREHTDQGMPSLVADPTSDVSQRFCDIARRAAAQLALQAKSHNTIFPKIVVQHT